MLHLMVLLVMVFLLGSISTFVWAYSLSSVSSTERSDYYLQQLTGMLLPLQPHELRPEARLSIMRAAAVLRQAAPASDFSSAFVDPGSSAAQNLSSLAISIDELSARHKQELDDWQQYWHKQAKLSAQRQPPEPSQQPLPPSAPPPPPAAAAAAPDAVPLWNATATGTRSASMDRFEGEPAPLHKRSEGGWLSKCTRAFKVPADLGKSEYWRERKSFYYYKHLHCVVRQYAAGANVAIDVGSALPPFINTFDWIPHRVILGPYFAGNVAKDGGGIHGNRSLALHRIEAKYGVRAIEADFATWEVPPELSLFDLVVCSEEVEHITKAAPFVQKLLSLGLVVVLSVPYRWAACNGCHHAHNDISLSQIVQWAGRRPFAYDVVKESNGDERIICVFRSSDGRALQSPRPRKPAAENFNGTSSSTDADASEPVKLTVLE